MAKAMVNPTQPSNSSTQAIYIYNTTHIYIYFLRGLLCGCLERFQRLQTLGQRRVRMVVGRVQPIDPDGRQVLHVESNKSRPKPVTHILHLLGVQLVLEFASELVSLKLEASTDGVHSHSNNGFYGHEDHLEQNERQNRRGLCRNFFREVKCSEEPWGVNEGREESEDREDVDLRNDEELCWMHVVPVAKFMSWRNIKTDENKAVKLEKWSLPRTASTSSALLCLIRVSKMTICLLCESMSKPLSVSRRNTFTHGRPKK